MIGKSFYDEFNQPSADYKPANYWFWQRIPEKEEIDAQLKEMLKAGFQTFFIQPRLAFPIEKYLSKEYLEAYRYAIVQANKLGLKAGIYDDYNWNSGHGGGLTVKNHDEFRERQLFWTSRDITDKSFILEISEIHTLMGDTLGGPQGHWTYEGRTPIWDDWKLIKVLAYSTSHELSTNDQIEDLSRYCEINRVGIDQCNIMINLPNDKYKGLKITAFIATRCKTSRHINYLNRQATSHFIKVGYEPYKKAVGDYFGKTIFCMFMDHPHAGFYSWKQKEGEIKNSLMFDESLIKTFSDEHQYPIELALLSFLLPETQNTNKMRGDFFNTYGHMARENFLGQISAWSHKNGLEFAGHELFGFLGVWGFYGGYHVVDQRTDFGGDYFGIGHYKDISTVDAFNSNPQIDAKVGDSVARANGKHGCLLEQYYFYPNKDKPGAIGHWNLTYEEMRAQAVRHTLFGTRQFIFHGFYLTDSAGSYELLASSRFDFAPAVNYEPWFRHHSNFSQELSRLSSFIYLSEPFADIAVLYPLSTFWVEETDGIFGADSGVWHEMLLEYGLGFDIIEEQTLRFDPSHPGKIIAGKNLYKILVLPGVKVLKDMNIVNDILDFVKTGGRLIFTGRLPVGTINGQDETSVNDLFTNLIDQKVNVQFYPKIEKSIDQIVTSIKTNLNDRPIIQISNNMAGQIWSWAGQNGTSTLVSLFNDCKDLHRIEILVPKNNLALERWDVASGNRKEWLWFEQNNQSTTIKVDLKPGEIACFVITKKDDQEEQDHLINTELKVIYSANENDLASIKLEGELAGQFELNMFAKKESKKALLKVPPLPKQLFLKDNWTFSTPATKEPINIDIMKGWEVQGFADYAGEGIYSTRFELQSNSLEWRDWDWKLVFPNIVSSAEIILNGETLGFLSWSPYEILLPISLITEQSNRLMVKVFNTGGNHYYAGSPYHVDKFPSGIIGAPHIVPVKIFQIR